jgi:hypothetical protein
MRAWRQSPAAFTVWRPDLVVRAHIFRYLGGVKLIWMDGPTLTLTLSQRVHGRTVYGKGTCLEGSDKVKEKL